MTPALLPKSRAALAIAVAGIACVCLANDAHATCSRYQKTVFSCTTPKGKQIALCDTQRELEYRYGLPDAYEVKFRVPRPLAGTHQWSGTGRYKTYSIELPAANADYTVFWSMDNADPDKRVDAGVLIEVEGRNVNTLICSQRKPITQAIQGIDLPSLDSEP